MRPCRCVTAPTQEGHRSLLHACPCAMHAAPCSMPAMHMGSLWALSARLPASSICSSSLALSRCEQAQVEAIRSARSQNHALHLGQHAVEERVVAARGAARGVSRCARAQVPDPPRCMRGAFAASRLSKVSSLSQAHPVPALTQGWRRRATCSPGWAWRWRRCQRRPCAARMARVRCSVGAGEAHHSSVRERARCARHHVHDAGSPCVPMRAWRVTRSPAARWGGPSRVSSMEGVSAVRCQARELKLGPRVRKCARANVVVVFIVVPICPCLLPTSE